MEKSKAEVAKAGTCRQPEFGNFIIDQKTSTSPGSVAARITLQCQFLPMLLGPAGSSKKSWQYFSHDWCKAGVIWEVLMDVFH